MDFTGAKAFEISGEGRSFNCAQFGSRIRQPSDPNILSLLTLMVAILGTPVDCVSLTFIFVYTGDQRYQHRAKLWIWDVCSYFRNGLFIVHFLIYYWFIPELCRFHSSAIAAAREALVYGVPSIAISLNWWDASTCIEFIFQIFCIINVIGPWQQQYMMGICD